MYQFSRAIYRELAPQILEPAPGVPGCKQPCGGAARLRGRHHAHGDRSPLLRAPGADAVLRHPRLLPDVRAGARPHGRRPLPQLSPSSSSTHTRTRATPRSAARPRAAARRPAKARPASARRWRATATARPTSTSRTPRTASWPPPSRQRDLPPPALAARRTARSRSPRLRRCSSGSTSAARSPTPCWSRPDGAVHTAKVPSTPSEEPRGVMRAVAAVLAARGRARRRRSSASPTA